MDATTEARSPYAGRVTATGGGTPEVLVSTATAVTEAGGMAGHAAVASAAHLPPCPAAYAPYLTTPY